MTEATLEKLEEVVVREQITWIAENFGKEACERANYGWGVDSTSTTVVVSTKVYGHGVLTSSLTVGDEEPTHLFKPFK